MKSHQSNFYSRITASRYKPVDTISTLVSVQKTTQSMLLHPTSLLHSSSRLARASLPPKFHHQARSNNSKMSFSRLIRFTAPSNPSKILLGEPIDESLDVGLALRKGAKDVRVKLFSGTSALNPGDLTDKDETVGRILSPLSQEEVGTIRCIGLNVCSSPFTSSRSRKKRDSNRANGHI